MHVMRCGAAVLLMGLAIACGRDRLTAPGLGTAASTSNTIGGNLTVSPAVSILAVGGTQQLSVSGTSLTGAPITAFDSVKYLLNSLPDSTRVRVTATGLVTGLAPSSSPILVNVFAIKDGAARAEQVALQVTATAVPGLALSIQPVAPDSAKLAVGSAKTIVPILMNPGTGANVPNPVIRYTVKPGDVERMGVYVPSLELPGSPGLVVVSGPTFQTPGLNQILARVAEGSAWVYAAVNAYGTILQDSVQYAFSYPFRAVIGLTVNSGFSVVTSTSGGRDATVTLASGATVFMVNFSAVPPGTPGKVMFTFDNPAAATAATPPSTNGGASGNVTPLLPGQNSARVFAPGVYTVQGMTSGAGAPWDGQMASWKIIVK